MINASVLTSNNKEEYVAFVDQIVQAFLPDRNENPEPHNLVKLYQLYRHPRACKEYKNEPCRFKFGKFFPNETLVAEPLPEICEKKLRFWFCAKEMKYIIKSETI